MFYILYCVLLEIMNFCFDFHQFILFFIDILDFRVSNDVYRAISKQEIITTTTYRYKCQICALKYSYELID